VFKWVCLLVAVAALAVFGWMLNDMRLEVKGLVHKADRLADQAEELAQKTEALVQKTDKQLPQILTQSEQTTAHLDRHLPKLLNQAEDAARTINAHLPTLLKRSEALVVQSEVAVDNLSEMSESFKQYKGVLGVVHAATQNKGLLGYGLGVLNFLGGHKARIGVKKPGSAVLVQAVSAREWVGSAHRDVHFLSLFVKSKEELLHGLARSNAAAPLHIQVGDQPPRRLAAWIKEAHPESKELR
jgi:hypothetical protein